MARNKPRKPKHRGPTQAKKPGTRVWVRRQYYDPGANPKPRDPRKMRHE